MTTTVYISIGNSDDQLSQAEWSQFCASVANEAAEYARVHGSWFSVPFDRWQNACWCVEFESQDDADGLKSALLKLRDAYRQDSIAWAVAETEFIGGGATREWAPA